MVKIANKITYSVANSIEIKQVDKKKLGSLAGTDRNITWFKTQLPHLFGADSMSKIQSLDGRDTESEA